MEEEIWSRLPLELVMVVLAYLPYPSLVRFKSVCKLWNSLPSTASFQQLCQHLPLHQHSYLLLFGRYESRDICVLYAPTTRRWHEIALKLPLKDNLGYGVRAADGGLFCTTDDGLTVYNPLLNSSRQLPALPHNNSEHVEMVNVIVDRCSNTDKVLVMSDDDKGRWRTYIYGSVCECWTETGKMPTVPGIAYWRGSVICGPTLFALFCTYVEEKGYMLMACDIGTGVWTKVAARMPEFAVCECNEARPSLVETGGRLLLAGVPECHHDPDRLSNSSLVICVWEFKGSTTSAEWLETVRTVIHITTSLYHFQVVSHDNLIFWCDRSHYYANPRVFVMYDLKQDTWPSPQDLFPPEIPVSISLVSGGLSLGAKV